ARRRLQRHAARVAQEQRQSAETTGAWQRRRSVEGDTDAAVLPKRTGEIRHARAVERHPEPAANCAVAFFRADDPAANGAVLRWRLPREADARSEVVLVRVVRVGARRILDQLRVASPR